METNLHDAISHKDLAAVKKLLKKGADPNSEQVLNNGNRHSPLYEAIDVYPNEEIAELLVNFGADINHVSINDGAKVPILNAAICRKFSKIIKLILSKKTDLNCERILANGHHYSALYDSVDCWPNDDFAAELINYGANVNYSAVCGTDCDARKPVLDAAVSRKNIRIVRLLLEKGADPNCERTFIKGGRYSALRDSIIEWPDDAIAEILINFGANVNYIETQSSGSRVPVLTSAICEKNIKVTRLLLAKGADPSCERVLAGGDRYSALRDSIIQWPNDEIAEMLISYGANVNYVETQSGSRVPVLTSAIYMKNIKMVRILLDKGSDPNCERVLKEGGRYSALRDSIAAWPSDEIAELLISHGADVNYIETQSSGARIPVLTSAISKNNIKIIRQLLDKGADPNCERIVDSGSHFGALNDSIIEWPNDEIAEILISHGANVNQLNLGSKNEKSPVLIAAICRKNVKMIKLLLDNGADPNSERILTNGQRHSALYDSINGWPDDEIAEILINYGADVNYVGTHPSGAKIPVLNNAICMKNVRIVKLLLEKGAKPDCERILADGSRYNALYDALNTWPNNDIAKLLKDFGASEEKTQSGSVTGTFAKEAVKPVQDNKAEEKKSDGTADLQQELESLVGLTEVKKNVNEMISILKVNELRRKSGILPIKIAKHMVFTGNPGTGKTTVARILAGIYKELGVLSKGQLIEVDRSGLVASYVGQTEAKTQEVIKQAMGGILFIDEAYALAKEGNDYGQDAINTILKAMEDNRDDFVVIAAGYPDLMENFINSNPGLRSRFTKYINFPDYTADEMQQIFNRMASKDGYALDPGSEKKLLKLWESAQNSSDFGNGRGVRNVYEGILSKQSGRVVAMSSPTKDDLLTIKPQDIPESVAAKKSGSVKIGFDI